MEQDTEITGYELRMIKSALERDIAIEALKSKYLISGTLAEQMDQVVDKISAINEPEPEVHQETVPEEATDQDVAVPVPDQEQPTEGNP